jgi:hypothetical protein
MEIWDMLRKIYCGIRIQNRSCGFLVITFQYGPYAKAMVWDLATSLLRRWALLFKES